MSGLARVGSTNYALSTHRDECFEEESIVDVAEADNTMKLLELLSRGYNPNEKDEVGYTPLHWFARHNNPKAIEALVNAGANPYIEDNNDLTPIRAATIHPRRAAVKALLRAYKTYNEKDLRMHEAINSNDIGNVCELMKSGANPLSKDEKGITPLELAIKIKHSDIIEAMIMFYDIQNIHKNLISVGCFIPNLIIYEGPLYNALRYHDVEGMQVMLEEGADVDDRDIFLRTPLMTAVIMDFVLAVRILLRAGADSRTTNLCGETALHLAMWQGCENAARLLLERGVDVNAQTFENKKTPLHYAKEFHPELIPLLLEHGADPSIKDAEGKDCQLDTEDSSCESSVCCGPIEYND